MPFLIKYIIRTRSKKFSVLKLKTTAFSAKYDYTWHFDLKKHKDPNFD